MSERVRRMRRGLERREKAHLALTYRSLKKRNDKRTQPPYALLLPQELAELSLKSAKRHGVLISYFAYLNHVSEALLSRIVIFQGAGTMHRYYFSIYQTFKHKLLSITKHQTVLAYPLKNNQANSTHKSLSISG